MKTATLTYQRHDNIGAMLQCYALQQRITAHGVENVIIDYICDAADRPLGLKSFRVKGVKKYITSLIGVVSRLPKKRAFLRFRKQHLKMTKKVDKRDVSQYADAFDGYIVGSDNVWNSKLTGLDLNYFLAFVSDDRKKASYAASLGLAAIPAGEEAQFKAYLERFAIITLRERQAADAIGALLGRDVGDACDPTLLLSAGEWDALAVEPKNKGKYILVYQMSPSYSFVKFAKAFGRRKNLPLVYVPFPYGPCKCAMKPHIGPPEWLGLVKHAEYIITDSFHGCVFSSIYRRNLIIKISQLGERIRNLSEKLGMLDRIVTTPQEASALPPIDYASVAPRLEAFKAKGEATLTEILAHFSEVKELKGT